MMGGCVSTHPPFLFPFDFIVFSAHFVPKPTKCYISENICYDFDTSFGRIAVPLPQSKDKTEKKSRDTHSLFVKITILYIN